MTASMTAFAHSRMPTSWGQLSWEIRSTNHRYLDTSLRLPEPLRTVEETIREHINKQLSRGKIECCLRFQVDRDKPGAMTINSHLVDRLTEMANEIEKRIHESSSMGVTDILNWPGVITDDGIDYSSLADTTLDLLDDALQDLINNRQREGKRLEEMVRERLTGIAEQIETVRSILPEIIAAFRQRLESRLNELKESLDPARIEQEVVIFANKSDVAEELDRLASHITETQHTLTLKKPVGRRLDFLMQEMNREANTLGSKSSDIRVTKASIELKVLIEQIREQVQNIE
ncbi:MAG: YicC family protein [Gammaproteobacteria bacterium]|nr:YicC family protein [Gammaproteobacteria bacterium]